MGNRQTERYVVCPFCWRSVIDFFFNVALDTESEDSGEEEEVELKEEAQEEEEEEEEDEKKKDPSTPLTPLSTPPPISSPPIENKDADDESAIFDLEAKISALVELMEENKALMVAAELAAEAKIAAAEAKLLAAETELLAAEVKVMKTEAKNALLEEKLRESEAEIKNVCIKKKVDFLFLTFFWWWLVEKAKAIGSPKS